MPKPTFYQPIETVLNGKCDYTYYDYLTKSFSKEKKTRICKLRVTNTDKYNDDIVMMIFTIRNQNDCWKIHSEGAKRLGSGDTVPLRNAAVAFAKENNLKYISVAVVSNEVSDDEIIKQYIVAIESYYYGDNTVYDLSGELTTLVSIGLPDFYRTSIVVNGRPCSLSFVKKDRFIDYLRFFDDRPYQYEHREIVVQIDEKKEAKVGGTNELYYGVPGAGKSHTIDERIDGSNYERVVFHPDYSYSDFVGQIMPVLIPDGDESKKLTYKFVPGPFVKALKNAIATPSEDYYLIIEEINRGNAPAIFGDVFQLLDRDNDGSSKYHITNLDIGRELFNDEDAEIKIPSNLSILATMNTSDQNVFTLDTAFQRRWKMKYIKNDVYSAEHANKCIENSNITWGGFAATINEVLLDYSADLGNAEDKQLGAYFVLENELSNDLFPEKALKYLWDDAFKMNPDFIFNTGIRSIGDIVFEYQNTSTVDPLSRIMKKEIYDKMLAMSKNDEGSKNADLHATATDEEQN